MIQTSPTMRILVATQPVDFRKGIDGLAAICRKQLEKDPMTGCAFVFRNRKATAIKILLYDGRGFWLCQLKLPSESPLSQGETELGSQAASNVEAAACDSIGGLRIICRE